jgi:23S rRNA (adenine2030-N6)-methyltransferase
MHLAVARRQRESIPVFHRVTCDNTAMLSYLHGFHAGNQADVHKHAIFAALLQALAAKAKPFAVLDVYAGHAVYDLGSEQALKKREFEAGIARLRAAPADDALRTYIGVIAALNPSGELTSYPGSPEIARRLMRADDALFVNELHPAEYRALRRWASSDTRVRVHRRDAIEAMSALLPPKPRRGLLLVDPPYEVKDEYRIVAEAVPAAARKWPEGIVMVWYPILADARHVAMVAELRTNLSGDVLTSELRFKTTGSGSGLLGSGVLVINPPWQFAKTLEDIERALRKALSPSA